MDRVKGLRLGGGQLHAALGDDAQAGVFQHGVDLAGQIAAGGVGFDDGQRALGGHGRFPFQKYDKEFGAPRGGARVIPGP